jgi:hypothetical protein
MRRFAADLAAVAALRVNTDEAADIAWATNAPAFHQLLVTQRGWTPNATSAFSPISGVGSCCPDEPGHRAGSCGDLGREEIRREGR